MFRRSQSQMFSGYRHRSEVTCKLAPSTLPSRWQHYIVHIQKDSMASSNVTCYFWMLKYLDLIEYITWIPEELPKKIMKQLYNNDLAQNNLNCYLDQIWIMCFVEKYVTFMNQPCRSKCCKKFMRLKGFNCGLVHSPRARHERSCGLSL